MKLKNAELNTLEVYIKNNKIATLEQLKCELNTNSNMTLFRKLKSLNYLSSYSHRGKYYTLESIAEFDEFGLWNVDSICFSRYGNLIETTREFVGQSKVGLSAYELRRILNVEVKHPLVKLFREQQIYREKLFGSFIYFSSEPEKRRRQILLRKSGAFHDVFDFSCQIDLFKDELKAAVILFYSLLNEQQRRLYAGLESFKHGYGGDKKVGDILGLNSHTVATGRRELFAGDVGMEGIRKKGGGRKIVEKKFRN